MIIAATDIERKDYIMNNLMLVNLTIWKPDFYIWSNMVRLSFQKDYSGHSVENGLDGGKTRDSEDVRSLLQQLGKDNDDLGNGGRETEEEIQ